MIFRYRSPVGTFVIAPQECGYFELLFGEETLARYRSADEAAHEVYNGATGCARWDHCRRDLDVPEGIKGWESWQVAGNR